jgi:hypothetical protein
MPTFADLYCARNRCAPPAFKRAIFWRTLRWPALPLAPVLLAGGYFDSAGGLIDACARATCMEQIQAELETRPTHAQHGRWLQRHARLWMSTRRLRQLAACYLMNAKPEARRDHGPGLAVAALAGSAA